MITLERMKLGHTFNLNDCISTNGCTTGTEPTIMRGHSDGITSSNTFNTSGPKEWQHLKGAMSIALPGAPRRQRLQPLLPLRLKQQRIVRARDGPGT